MQKIVKALVAKLEYKVSQICIERYGRLERRYLYLCKDKNTYLRDARRDGWNQERFTVLFALNSFYQVVIGPLTCSAVINKSTRLGSDIPISYGKSLTFDSRRNREMIYLAKEFNELYRKLGFDQPELLGAQTADDIIYRVAKRARLKREFDDMD